MEYMMIHKIIVLIIFMIFLSISIFFMLEFKWNKRLFKYKQKLNEFYRHYKINDRVYYYDVAFTIITLMMSILGVILLILMLT